MKKLSILFFVFIFFTLNILNVNPVICEDETEVPIILRLTNGNYLREYKYPAAIISRKRLYIPLGQVTLIEGYTLEWDAYSKELTITITEYSPFNLLKKRVVIRYNLKKSTTYLINEVPYYFIEEGRGIPIRVILEPLYKVQWEKNGDTHIIWAYENEFYNRVKLLPKSSEVIINYELHKLNSGLIKQNEEIFVSLREFIELMKGKIEYNPTSEYNSPEIAIKPANIDKEIKIYPKIGKAVLINNDSKEEKEITFTKKMISRNSSYFIGVDDLISILQAEKHTYLDSDVNVYFNFEF